MHAKITPNMNLIIGIIVHAYLVDGSELKDGGGISGLMKLAGK